MCGTMQRSILKLIISQYHVLHVKLKMVTDVHRLVAEKGDKVQLMMLFVFLETIDLGLKRT